ncbi:hypothetical protein Q1695_008846 [Nippostrongylus brasiliensis]|nr:hypothetical protein Q1695_008846 [Nippostrongylus brasiliensis]
MAPPLLLGYILKFAELKPHPKKKSSRMAAGLSRQQSFDTSAHQSTQALTPMPRPPVKNPSPRKKPPHELTRLKSKLAPSSPLPFKGILVKAKRVARRTQHYECDTFSTLTRRRCVIAKRPSLKEALEVPTTKSQKRPTPRYTLARFPPNSVSTDGSPLPFAHLSMPSAVPENSRTAPKIAPKKKIKFIINPEESADITTTNVAPTIVTNPENVEPDAEHEEPPRKAK